MISAAAPAGHLDHAGSEEPFYGPVEWLVALRRSCCRFEVDTSSIHEQSIDCRRRCRRPSRLSVSRMNTELQRKLNCEPSGFFFAGRRWGWVLQPAQDHGQGFKLPHPVGLLQKSQGSRSLPVGCPGGYPSHRSLLRMFPVIRSDNGRSAGAWRIPD